MLSKMIVQILLLQSFFHLSVGEMKKYTNYTLYRTVPLSQSHVEFLQKLYTEIPIDFWRAPGSVNKPVDLLIGPEWKEVFQKSMNENQYQYTVVMEDVQRAINNQTVKNYIRRQMDSFDWKSYFRLKDIYDWMKDLEKKYPEDVTILEIGKTFEGRKILAAKVRMKNAKIRSTVFVEGGIHAREWVSISFVTYFLNQVVTSGKSDELNLWKKLALTYEWYFVPVTNPDGYEYTHTNDRLWRKNRSDGGVGVDINRNFDIAFGTTGISTRKHSETYCGPYAFSEKEAKALAELIKSRKDNIEYYLAFHSYGQYIIIPYAHSKEHLANYNEVANILVQAKYRIAERYRTKYTVGTAYSTVGYTTSGVSGCWAKAAFDIRYVATFELRDAGYHGFTLPADYILPTCLETIDGMAYILLPKNDNFLRLNHKENDPWISHSGQKALVIRVDSVLFLISIFIVS